jgi:glutamate/tyrosine decarboxylase-like PLP-dependent enzyme
MQNFDQFPFESVGAAVTALVRHTYNAQQLAPQAAPEIATLPVEGEGLDGLSQVFESIVEGSAGLACASMMGHMDTAPHPAAAFCDALVSALNNNLLFREISPFASRVEEMLVDDIGARLGLSPDWCGTFVSGGSLANLTALFAATGGFAGVGQRGDCVFFLPSCAHVSVQKSLAVLGIGDGQVHAVASDSQGRAVHDSLVEALRGSNAKRKIVVGVLGSTTHGAVEDISALAPIAKAHNAWLHVDAIYGGALAFSQQHRHLLAGLTDADSVVVGPQKWLYVPRLSAIVWVKDRARFDAALGVDLPYSASGESHRGRWGIQGSRRADALTLWSVLRYVGTRELGESIDRAIALTRKFHAVLEADSVLHPSHVPDLNLLCFGLRHADARAMKRAHEQLGIGDVPWVSLSRWHGELLYRAVLLSPSTNEGHLDKLIESVRGFVR